MPCPTPGSTAARSAPTRKRRTPAPPRTRAPHACSRGRWGAGGATSRGVRHALIALRGEMVYPSALSAPKWGFYDVLFRGNPFAYKQGFGSYVMENVLFKISFPAEFHAQTAVECAMRLHPAVRSRIDA